MKYNVTVPIVGYSTVFVEAESEEQAKEKTLDTCCNFDDKNVDVVEIYGVESVVNGNVCSHPFLEIDVEESI